MKEIWKPLKNYEKYYQISNFGKIKNNYNKILGWVQNTGYKTVSIKNKKVSLHRLVAEAFIPNPNNYPCVNHIDGNKLNNRVDNLEWCSYKHNYNEAIRIGLIKPKRFEKGHKIRSKKIIQYTLNGKYVNQYDCSIDAEKELKKQGIKINARNIRKVCNKERKTAGGFMWQYLRNYYKIV